MKIAINIPFYVIGSLDSGYAFNIELIKKIAISEPAHEFIIMQSGEPEEMQNLPKNISIHTLDSPGKNSLKWRLFYDYKIPSIIKKMGWNYFWRQMEFAPFALKFHRFYLYRIFPF